MPNDDSEIRMSREELREIIREAREDTSGQPIVVNVDAKSSSNSGAGSFLSAQFSLRRVLFWSFVGFIVILIIAGQGG